MNIVSRTIVIDRPCDIVQAQFADIVHHQQSAPHRNVRFTMIAESPDSCDYAQITRQGPLRLKQQFHLDRSNPRHQANVVTAGPFRRASINFDIEPTTPNSTTVTATIVSERAIHRFFKPILRTMLAKPLAAGLQEDKTDLESGTYPSAEHE